MDYSWSFIISWNVSRDQYEARHASRGNRRQQIQIRVNCSRNRMPRYGELDASLSSLVKVQLYIWSQFNVHSPCLLPVLPRTFGPARGVPRTVASVKESPPFASLVRGNPSKPRENTNLVKKQQLPMTRDYKRNLKFFRVDQHFNLCLTRLERIWTPAFPLGLNWKVGCLGLWRLGKRTRKGACLTGKSTGMVLEKVRKRYRFQLP